MEDKFNIIKSLQKNLNNIFSHGETIDENVLKCFKVLVFDDSVFSILSPLLKVFSLREQNICLHLNIKQNKEYMPNVMGIYLIEPTEENFELIKKDLLNNIFDNYYFVFTSTCYENQLKNFFSCVYEGNKNTIMSGRENIYKIESYPIKLLPIHNRIFSLNISNSYYLLTSPNSKESKINEYFYSIASGLFNLMFTLSVVPMIKYRTGWFAENIVKELQNIFNFNIEKYPEFKNKITKSETLLVLIDRETDIPIMLHHPASLGGMMQDLFGVSTTSSSAIKSDKKDLNTLDVLEIDPVEDKIWNEYCSESYIEVVEQIIKDEMKRITDDTKFLEDTNCMNNKTESDLNKLSEKMSATLDNLKDIQIKKNILNNYAKYHSQLYQEVNKRNLGEFYMIEEDMLIKRSMNDELKKRFWEIFERVKSNKNINNQAVNDIKRLSIIYFLINPEMKNEEYSEIEQNLKKINADISSLQFFKSKRDFLKSMSIGNQEKENNSVLHKGFSFLYNKIGNYIRETQPSIIADIVNNLCSNKEIPNYVEYNLLTKDKKQSGKTYSNIIVFVCGGGSLVEFESLDSFVRKKNIKLIYGTDTMYSPNEFVNEVERLYNKSNI